MGLIELLLCRVQQLLDVYQFRLGTDLKKLEVIGYNRFFFEKNSEKTKFSGSVVIRKTSTLQKTQIRRKQDQEQKNI